jgi:hypothetical protein
MFRIKTDDAMGELLHKFLNTDRQSFKNGNYEISGQHLVYRSMVTESVDIERDQIKRLRKLIQLIETDRVVLLNDNLDVLKNDLKNPTQFNGCRVQIRSLKQDVIASKLDNNGQPFVLGNSSILSLIGRTVSFGHSRVNRHVTNVQNRLSEVIPMLPFTVFQQADLDFRKIKILEQSKPESVTRKNPQPKYLKNGKIDPSTEFETVHFTGASLFEIDGVTFLFDLDRNELKHKRFNPFLVKLTKPVTTIKQAYESLKPDDVVKAETQGLKVKRQGEWFFIPADTETSQRLNTFKDRIPDSVKQITLRAGNNRPNYATGIQLHKGNAVTSERGLREQDEIKNARIVATESEYYVTGKVTHSGREHEDLNLKQWYKALPNTAIESFTITGNID